MDGEIATAISLVAARDLPGFLIVSPSAGSHAPVFHVTAATTIPHPPGFRCRRGVNWTVIGLLYTSFYMCRYNLSLSNQAISTEFGFSKAQMERSSPPRFLPTRAA